MEDSLEPVNTSKRLILRNQKISETVISDYNNGKSCPQIATSLKINVKTIRNILRVNKIPIRQARKNLLGKTFSRLKVIKVSQSDRSGKSVWKCLCECGRTHCVRASDLISGKIKSCGCLHAEKCSERGKTYVGMYVGSKSKNWRGFEEISGRYLSTVKASAMRRRLEFNISLEQMWKKFLEQDRKCALSGVPIFFNKTSGSKQTASLDRINSEKGYIEDNIQWVHKVVNMVKLDLSEDILYSISSNIVKTLGKRNYGTLWGSKCYLIGNLQNSEEKFVIQWREKFSKEMRKLGIVTMSPLEKVFTNFDTEGTELHKKLSLMLDEDKYEEVHKIMKAIRRRDLAMVDHSNFIVGVLDPERPTFGTTEEISFASRANKPIYLVIKGGIKEVPYWLAGILKKGGIYNSLEEIIEELKKISSGKEQPAQETWRIFDERFILV